MCVFRQPKKKGKREAMWRVMRFYQKTGCPFTIREITMATDSRTNAVNSFVRLLVLAGVLAVGRQRVNGLKGSRSAYRMARDLGPKCPSNRKGGLYDPNAREYLELKETRKYNKRQGGNVKKTDWKAALRRAAKEATREEVGRLLGVGASIVGRVLAGTYEASTACVEARVRKILMGEPGLCPHLARRKCKGGQKC